MAKYTVPLWLLLLVPLAMAQVKPVTPLDIVTLPRPSGLSASPNGSLAVYTQSVYDSKADKTLRQLLLLDIENDLVKALTEPSSESSQSEPFFLDNDNVAYMQHTAGVDVDQIHVLNLESGDAYALTDYPIDFGNIKYNPKKNLLVFSASVYAGGSLEEAKEKDKVLKETKKDTGLVYDQLMVRHWDTFVPEKVNNIFAVQLEKGEKYTVGNNTINLLKGTTLQSPGFPMGDASDFDISADGETLAFVSKIRTPENGWQTSQHVHVVPTSGEYRPVALNGDIPAASSGPKFAPSGVLAYLQMYVPQYESDRNRIIIWDPKTDTKTTISESWDRSPSEVAFSPDSDTLFAIADEYGRHKLFSIDLATEEITTLTNEHALSGLSVLSSSRLLFSLNSLEHPNIPYTLDLGSKELTKYSVSEALSSHLEGLDMSKPDEFVFQGALDDPVHGWILKPVDFDASKKYPVAFLIHGGPQGAWSDSWSTRWNPQVFAGTGYVVVAINPHGSTGYGQQFTDDINQNWGSYPFEDLQKGLDYVLDTNDFLDADRLVALGGSYGGYMINWINGHTNRFKALVNHDGIFSTLNAYYTTDEVYFSEREFGGVPFKTLNRLVYEYWSPSNYVQHWQTPTLVIHSMS
ncbi:Alpha/Beta hydrolase protein [Phycomyces nitens]|nr:Alpha/Beta hydrolase protein [Phycomyces nitens]